MLENKQKIIERCISATGLAILTGIFIFGFGKGTSNSAIEWLSALVSTVLFAWLCLQFVPILVKSWSPEENPGEKAIKETDSEPPHMCLKIFGMLLLFSAAVLIVVYKLRYLSGHEESFREALSFWKCLDSEHYLCIARDGYLSEGEWDRLVQLVFLPGYPLAVRLVNYIVNDFLYSSLIVSAFSFAGAGCLVYRLLRLDYSHSTSIRAVKYMCIIPGSFFFAAPMSESLFILLSAACLYGIRRKKWLSGCIFGALAAFTRSLGIILLVPVLYEFISEIAKNWNREKTREDIKKRRAAGASILLIPAGFAAYCFINYLVSGNFFKFMEYQHENWHQGFGWFFNTAAYQLEYAIKCASSKPNIFIGLWLPNLIAIFGSLIIMVFAVKKLRPSYVAWFIAYFVVAIGATWLLSAPRYMITLTVIPLALALLNEKRSADMIFMVLCLFTYPVYLYAFVMRWQVW